MNSKQVVLITGSSIGFSRLADTLARKGRPRPGSAHQGVTRAAIARQSDCNNVWTVRYLALCNRRGTSEPGEFSEQWREPMRLFKFLAQTVLAITLAGVAAKANAQSIDELYGGCQKGRRVVLKRWRPRRPLRAVGSGV
jgi:hypothetical protein